MNIKNFLFKYRGHTPIPLSLLLLYSAKPTLSFLFTGAIIIIFGELIRMIALKSIGGRTRTRKVGAKVLCTWGIYAHVRNPLYIGNLFIYFGIVIAGQGPWFYWLILLTLFFFIIQYSQIISLEEKKLESIFGEDYRNYKQKVPKIIPSFKKSIENGSVTYRTWFFVFKNEKSTLLSQLSLFSILIIKYIYKI